MVNFLKPNKQKIELTILLAGINFVLIFLPMVGFLLVLPAFLVYGVFSLFLTSNLQDVTYCLVPNCHIIPLAPAILTQLLLLYVVACFVIARRNHEIPR